MRTFLIIILVVSGILFIGSVLLMSPKGGLGIGIGGLAGGGEYGSKKSVETTLKKVAYVTAIIFVLCAVTLPYLRS